MRALETLWPHRGIDFSEQQLDLDRVFGRSAPRVLDIGFGDGEALFTSAANHPDVDYLGVEVHEPGVGHLLVLLEQAGLDNLRIVNRDVVDVVDHMLSPSAFDVVDIFFPDPWPKKRHHKRRLINRPFVERMATVMKPGGLLHVATDWANYAEQIEAVLAAAPAFGQVDEAAASGTALAQRPPTKFERRGRRLGHDVVDLYYLRA